MTFVLLQKNAVKRRILPMACMARQKLRILHSPNKGWNGVAGYCRQYCNSIYRIRTDDKRHEKNIGAGIGSV